MPLPCDHDLMARVAQDRWSMLQCSKRAGKRRAWPEWGLPVEATLLLLDPKINLGSPDELSERREARAIREAEKRNDEEELEKLSSACSFRRGRQLLATMGWDGGRLGVREGMVMQESDV
eukprot:2688336-Pyramimonas_sp.AAC.1